MDSQAVLTLYNAHSPTRGGGVTTYRAIGPAGQALLLHVTAEGADGVKALIHGLDTARKSAIREVIQLSDGVAVLTDLTPGLEAFETWLGDGVATGRPAAPPSFTQFFQRSDLAGLDRPEPPQALPHLPATGDAGQDASDPPAYAGPKTQFFVSARKGELPRPPKDPPPETPKAKPSRPQAPEPVAPAADPTERQHAPGQKAGGSFTQFMQKNPPGPAHGDVSQRVNAPRAPLRSEPGGGDGYSNRLRAPKPAEVKTPPEARRAPVPKAPPGAEAVGPLSYKAIVSARSPSRDTPAPRAAPRPDPVEGAPTNMRKGPPIWVFVLLLVLLVAVAIVITVVFVRP